MDESNKIARNLNDTKGLRLRLRRGDSNFNGIL